MPVQKQLIPVQFGGGINTKVDPHQLQAGQLLDLQNGQFSKQGQINKRFGYDILTKNIEGGGSITNGVELANYKNELILFDGTNIYSYIPSTGNWSNRGTAISVITEDKNIIRRSDAQQLNPDFAYLNGCEVYAWEDSRGGIRISLLDSSTKAYALSDHQLSSFGQQPKCLSFQNLIYIFFEDGGNNLYYSTINPFNPSVVGPLAIITGDGFFGTNGFPYDATVIGHRIYIAYLSNSTSTGAIKLLGFDSNFTQISLAVVNNIVNQAQNTGYHGAINVAGDNSLNVWVSWANGQNSGTGSIFTAAYTFNNSLLLGTTTVDNALNSANGTVISAIQDYQNNNMRIFYEVSAPLSYNQLVKIITVNTSGVLGTSTILRSVGLASKAFNYNNSIYINTAYDSPLQATDFTWYIPATGSPVIISKITPSVGSGLLTNGMCPEIPQISPGIFKFANLETGKLISEANTVFTLLGVNSTKLTFIPTNNFVNTVQANTLLVVGGILQGYDGNQTTELGFHIYPESIQNQGSALLVGTPGGLTNGTYQYIVCFEWTDNNGQIYRSAPSIPLTVNYTTFDPAKLNGQTISGPTLRLTTKSKVSVVIYRTQANGTIFRRVSSSIAPLINDPTQDAWTFTDTLDNTSQAANEILYTTGNILSNIAPPANSIITTYNNRVFLAGLSDKLLMWYSQTVVDNSNQNTIPPQFAQELTIACDPRGGDITALGLLNSALIIFKEREIFALQGNGPDATGNNNDFGDPSLITSDVGCINANSVIIMPQGLMFQSRKGIYLLDQSLNVSYIGAPVEDFNSYNITSAIQNPQDNQVIFTTSNGLSLVYDYYFQQWATWTNQYAADAGIYNNLFCFLKTDGSVYLQNRSKFTDGSLPVYLSFTLPNLSFSGLQGYQRVFRAFILGTYKGPHTLIAKVAYDYNDNYTQSATITPSTNISTWGSDALWGSGVFWGGQYQIYEFRLDFNIQKCTSIRLQIADNQASNYNEGYAISSVVFEVGALPGGNRLPTTNTYGAS